MRFAISLVLVLLAASSARADARCREEIPDREVRARLDYLLASVRREEPPVRRWFTTFAFLHGTMGSTAGILAATAQEDGFRNEMLVGATSSTLALLTLVVFLPPLLGAGDTLRALPDDTPERRLRKLRAAEDIMRRAASTTDFLQSWVPPVLSTLYVAAAASTLLLAFQRPTGAITHSIGGAVLGLGRLLLHPTGGRTAWRRYASAHPDVECEQPAAAAPAPTVAVVPQALGLGLRIEF